MLAQVNKNRIILHLLEGLIFILPLSFLPKVDKELSKQLIVLFFSIFVFIILLFQSLSFNHFKWQKTLLDIPLIVFLVSIFLSCLFGVDWHSSLFGYWDNYSYSFFIFLCFIVLYFFVTHLRLSSKNIFRLLLIFFSSYLLGVLIYAVSSIFINRPINTFGASLYSLLLLSVVISILIINLIINFSVLGIQVNKKTKYFILVVLFLSLSVLLIFNFKIGWFLIIISLCFNILFSFLLFRNYFAKKKVLILILCFLILACFNFDFILLKKQNNIFSRLDYRTSTVIIKNSLKQHPYLGNGLATFAYSFSLYRPTEFNYNTEWQKRFAKSYSYFFDLINDVGLFGISFYLLIVLSVFFASYFLIQKNILRNIKKNRFTIAILIALINCFFALFILQFFYPFDLIVIFVFWFLLSLIAGLWIQLNISKELSLFGVKTYYFKNKILPKVMVIGLFLLTFGLVYLGVYETKIVLAAKIFNQEKDENSLLLASRLVPQDYYYHLALAKFYAIKAKNYVEDPSFKDWAQNSLNHLYRAIELAPNSVIVWETAGVIYKNFWPFVADSNKLAIDAFKKAIKLEPTNPVLLSELGKTYLISNNFIQAKESFQKAIDHKKDYYDAHLNLARAYIAMHNYSLALKILYHLKTVFPVSEVYYELGRTYYNMQEVKKAERAFKKAIELDRNNVNAWYSLGLVQEIEEKQEEALKSFQHALNIEPDNIQIKKKIKELNLNFER